MLVPSTVGSREKVYSDAKDPKETYCDNIDGRIVEDTVIAAS